MNSTLIGFDPATGRILSQVYGEIDPAQQQTLEDKGMGAVVVPNTIGLFSQYEQYILNGEVTKRPTSPVTRTDLTLHDVPNGATLWVAGASYSAEGEVELAFPLPGTFSLRVECFPYLDWNDEVAVP